MTHLDFLRRSVSSTLVLAARRWRRTSHGVLASYGVSEACAVPLLTANRLGEAVRQVTLAEHVGIEGPSLVRLLDQLCVLWYGTPDAIKDMVTQTGADRINALTAEGRAVTARMEERLVTLRARLLKGVSREDLETTLRVLNVFSASPDAKLLAALEAGDQTAKPARSAAKRGA